MKLDIWNVFLNILLMVFWFKIWNRDNRDSFFNPYLAPLNRFANATVLFLKPIFFGLPNTFICIAAFLFIIVFRAIMFYGLATRPGTSTWTMHLTVFVEHIAVHENIVSYLGFSFLSFMIFIFRIWSIALLYISKKGAVSGHTETALHHASAPFVFARVELRPLHLLFAGLFIQLSLNLMGPILGSESWPAMQKPEYLPLLIITALAGWAETLLLIQQLLIFLIIGSWISMLTSSFEMMKICRDWLDFLMGPMRRYPVRIGMIDLSPLIFIFLLGAIHTGLIYVLYGSFMRLI